MQRRVHTYRNYIDIDWSRRRIVDLNAEDKLVAEIAVILDQEGFVAPRGCAFKGENVWLLRTRWGIPTIKINGVDQNPMRWPDGSFSIRRAAAELGLTQQTVFDYLARGLLAGRQPAKGQYGRSSSQTNKSVSCAIGYDAPSIRRRRHHEVISSPITLCHVSTGTWLVTMVEARPRRSLDFQ